MTEILVDSVGPGGREMIPVADEVPAPEEVVSVEEASVEEAPKNKRRKKNA